MSDTQTVELSVIQAEAQDVVRAAEAAVQSQQPARFIEALRECDRVLQALPVERVIAESKAPDPADPLSWERALLWFWRGRLLVMADKPEAVVQGLHSFDQAIVRLRGAEGRRGAIETLALAWMNRGSGLFRLSSREALGEAVRSYDQAIEAMGRVEAVDPNTLGAAWMNRGVGLMHLDETGEAKESVGSRLADAAKSFERAVEILGAHAENQPNARRNLASAWANLGILRARLSDAEGAVEAHRLAVDLFRPIAAEGGPPEAFELAARLFNLGQAFGAASQGDAALAAGREALSVSEAIRSEDPQVLELRLRTRHALCVALGGRLAADRTKPDDSERSARLAEAGDLVEDGLAAVSGLATPPPPLAAAAAKLYEFGAWLYRTQQPQFLGEFLLEHLGEDPSRAVIASAAVQTTRQGLVQKGFNETAQGDMNRVLDILQSLGEVEARLKARGVAV